MNIVIPCSGLGSRFVAAGYSVPKPLIPIKGKPMIEHVLENIALPSDKIYIVCLAEHLPLFTSTNLLHCGNVCFVPQRGRLQGAVASVLLAKVFIDTDEPLIIANSDQWICYDKKTFREDVCINDGTIMTFESDSPKWSYARTNVDGRVLEVAEKVVISPYVTCGVYGWRRGQDFVDAALQMMAKDITTNGEFYVCPIFNEMLNDCVYIHRVEEMYGMGTPEDLEANYNLIGI